MNVDSKSVKSGNAHTLTMVAPTTYSSSEDILLDEGNLLKLTLVDTSRYHTLTMVTPLAYSKSQLDYEKLYNKPKINSVELIGDLSLEDIGINTLTDYEIDIITGSASTEDSLVELLALGGHIDLAADIVVSSAVSINVDTVLDLGNHTLSYIKDGYVFTADGAKLTLKNGSVTAFNGIATAENGGEIVIESGSYSSNVAPFAAMSSSKLTINGGSITAVVGVCAYGGGEIEINGGTITCTDGIPIFTDKTDETGGNKITVNGGVFYSNTNTEEYEACAMYIANDDIVRVNGGTFCANGGCGILIRGGTVTISNAEVTAIDGLNVPGYVGEKNKKMNASAVIFDQTSGYPGSTGMSLTINSGTFKGVLKSVEVQSKELAPDVYINGGEFDPAI